MIGRSASTPTTPWPTLAAAAAKSELGRHEEAIEDNGHAIGLDPDAASASKDR